MDKQKIDKLAAAAATTIPHPGPEAPLSIVILTRAVTVAVIAGLLLLLLACSVVVVVVLVVIQGNNLLGIAKKGKQ